ncbi:MAG: N-acyl-D-amino-acid deacylase family protein [Bacillota bacterium]|jgi:N-acyl-D-amino-acid deacylase
MLDLVLRNGTIIDGTGKPRFKADLGISKGKVVSMGNLSQAEAKRVIDISNLAVCPGFIDMHSHSDLSILAHRKATSSISQGITTEVIGSCGWSMAPCKDETKRDVIERLVKGLIDSESFHSMPWNWNSFGEYLDTVEATGTGVNLVPQVGQSLIRAHVVGTENRKATPGEIRAMKVILEQALEDGAWGMSTGRSYKPGGFAPTEEIIELAKVLAQYDAIYASHMKNESEELFAAVEEVIKIAEETGVRTEISHHKAVGKKNFGKVHKSLDMIDNARQKGLRITVDLYPYEFTQVSAFPRYLPQELWDHLEAQAQAVLVKTKTPNATRKAKPVFPSNEEIREKLNDPDIAEKIKSYNELGTLLERIKSYMIITSPSVPDLEGRILGEYAEEKGLALADFVIRLLLEDGFSAHAASPISIDDIHTVIKTPFASPGTDAFALDRPIIETPIHPRHFGTFPRVIGRFVKQDNLFSLEEAVRKCTGFPARTMGLPERGLIDIGYWADLVVFDPETVIDTATGKEPYNAPAGIEYVMVNGQVAFEKGKHTPVFSGKVLRRK